MIVKYRETEIRLEDEHPNCYALLKKIDKLAIPVLAAKVNGRIVDLNSRLNPADDVEFLTFSEEEGKNIFWHTSAHVLAQAILRLYPDAQPTIGPPIDDGFYYDFANLKLSEEDFSKVEDEIKKILKENYLMERIDYKSKEEALKFFKTNPFKVELIQSFDEGLSAYRQGDFLDLCRGPHIPRVGMIRAMKILKTSGAYWRANAENEQLTRVYGVSFPDKKQLKEHLLFLEEAKKRNHRLIGKNLSLFSFHSESPGMPFFHPKGMVVWDELMKFWHERHHAAGYQTIKTPILLNQELWVTSGHWDNYKENMYSTQIDDRDFAIKPMNCPGCCLYYKTQQYSYRQLPLRIAEIGHVHRHELSGALSGLFRVRCFHQDDSHLFMSNDQLKQEILGIIDLANQVYGIFGLEYRLELSTRPKKSIGSDSQWKFATETLCEALLETGKEFKINEGDGAFYGPKIDFHIKDAINRYWQCGTIQLDMNFPDRFDLLYDTSSGEKLRPMMLHRTIYGSIERFFGILIEHYKGRFPCWLSPEMIRILPISDRHHEYAEKITEEIKDAGLRITCDKSVESVNKKIRKAQIEQVNYMLVLGDQEVASGNFQVRTRENQQVSDVRLETLIDKVKEEYSERLPKTFFAHF